MNKNEPNYKLEDGMYVLYFGDKKNYVIGEEIAISYTYYVKDDKEIAFLYKIGSPELIQEMHDEVINVLNDSKIDNEIIKEQVQNMKNGMYYISGKFDIEDINKCVQSVDYVKELHKKYILEENNLEQKSINIHSI